MAKTVIDSIMAKLGCKPEDLSPIRTIAAKAIAKTAEALETEPIHLTLWSKENLIYISSAEWLYLAPTKSAAEKSALASDEKFTESMAVLVSEKFLLIFLKPNAYQSQISVFSPVSSTAEAALTQMDNLNSKLSKHDPAVSLIPDLFDRIFKEAIGIVKMLNLGLANDAYGSWRTLHEAECVIKLLLDGGNGLQQVYLKHIVYNNAFREVIDDTATTDRIFAQMKAEMKEHGLKSKDMKKYIEYGWLYSSKSFDSTDPSYKLNFRDGVQKAAGLSKYSVWYEAASELSHSSPVFFYSSEEYFTELAVIGLYDVLERVEKLFYDYVRPLDVLTKYDDQSRQILLSEMLRIAADRRNDFLEKYKDAALYDDETL